MRRVPRQHGKDLQQFQPGPMEVFDDDGPRAPLGRDVDCREDRRQQILARRPGLGAAAEGQAAELYERVGDRIERPLREGPALGDDHVQGGRREPAAVLCDEPRLPHAGLTGRSTEAAAPLPRLAPADREVVQLCSAADERPRDDAFGNHRPCPWKSPRDCGVSSTTPPSGAWLCSAWAPARRPPR